MLLERQRIIGNSMPSTPNISYIANIANHLECLDTVVQWHRGEWGDDWANQVRQSTSVEGLPATYVALVDGEPIGTVMLTYIDMITRKDISPWLAGLYVKPIFRLRGIGTELAKYAMGKADNMGIKTLWLYTARSRSLYAALGWKYVGEDNYDGERVTIMQYVFSR